MKFNVYAIYNSMSELFYSEGLFIFNTDAHCQHLMASRIPDSDKAFNEIVCIGTINVVTGDITPCPHRVVDWKIPALIIVCDDWELINKPIRINGQANFEPKLATGTNQVLKFKGA